MSHPKTFSVAYALILFMLLSCGTVFAQDPTTDPTVTVTPTDAVETVTGYASINASFVLFAVLVFALFF